VRRNFPRFVKTLPLLLASILVGCGRESEIPARTDAEMTAFIVGTWVLDDGPFSLYYMEKTYSPDGTAAGFLLNRQTGKRIAFTGRWQIKNGYFSGEVLTSTDPNALPLRAAYWDKIVEITNNKWVMIEQGTGRVTFKHRKGHFALF
jgi:hypothetical protein